MTSETLSSPEQVSDRIRGTTLCDEQQIRISREATPNPKPQAVVGRTLRLRDVDDFPVGARVKTPTGRLGTVVAHRGAESRRDAHERCVVQYHDGGYRDRNLVALMPSLLVLADNGKGT